MHVAIIPDGNRRWAKQKGIPSFTGHAQGARAMEAIVRATLDTDVTALTVWGASLSNLTKRSQEEVVVLFGIFGEYFAKLAEAKELKEHNVRVRFLGRWEELLPEEAKMPMRKAMDITAVHTKRHLTFLIGYNGTDEVVAAVKNITEQKAKNPDMVIDEAAVKANLWTHDLPPVDLVIRTGGEPHWSAGFMMWDVAEAQLYFTETLWPAFTPKEFKRIVERHSKTMRRFGK